MKAAAQDYDHSGDAGDLKIGVIYMGRSFAGADRNTEDKQKTVLYDAGNFLVIEIAMFANKKFHGEISGTDFSLKLDTVKTPLLPASPGLVASHLKSREAEQRRGSQFGGAQPGQQPGFPGEAVPVNTYREWDAAIESAIPEGKLTSGRAGNLYFEFPGKLPKPLLYFSAASIQACRFRLNLR